MHLFEPASRFKPPFPSIDRRIRMPTPSPRRIVVIGAGLAGLAAAEAAADAGCEVILIEPSGGVGGVLGTVRRDGWLVERSADSFLAARPEGIDLVHRLGLAADLIGIAPGVRRALVLHRNRLVPVPAGFRLLAPGRVDGILATPLLSPPGRCRVLLERFLPARPATVSDESLEQFAVRRLGREAFERLVQPLASGIWTADPARLGMAAACPEFFEMERRHGSLWAGERARLRAAGSGEAASGARYGQFATLAGGMESLPKAFAAQLAGRGVQCITAAAEGIEPGPTVPPDSGRKAVWQVRLARAADGAGPIEADAVIVATPAKAAARLLRPLDGELADSLSGIEYAGSAIVSMGFRREDVSHPLDAAGLVVPRCEGRRILAVSFSSSKFSGRAPDRHVLLRTFVGGALDPATATLPDDRLTALVQMELESLLGARGTPALVQIDRWNGAMPQYQVGHRERIATIHERVAKLPGIGLAGAAYEGVGIPQVIASGRTAVEAVLAAIS
jgi:oxygen-dependent protoporphyrinogen oxidase